MAPPRDVPLAVAPATGRSSVQGRAAPTTQPTGVAAGSLVGAAAGTATGLTVAAVPAIPLALTAAGILEAVEEYLELLRFRGEDWVRRRVQALPQTEALRVIADEAERQYEFERRVRERMHRDAPRLEAIPDPKARREAVRNVMKRERTFARARAESMAVRVIAAVTRDELRTSSPTGAFWKLDPSVVRHTKDCLLMGDRFHPWEALALLHPPTHAGCRCALYGRSTAVARGWMVDSLRVDVAASLRRAQAALALIGEEEFVELEELREAVVATGVADEATFSAAVARLLERRGQGAGLEGHVRGGHAGEIRRA